MPARSPPPSRPPRRLPPFPACSRRRRAAPLVATTFNRRRLLLTPVLAADQVARFRDSAFVRIPECSATEYPMCFQVTRLGCDSFCWQHVRRSAPFNRQNSLHSRLGRRPLFCVSRSNFQKSCPTRTRKVFYASFHWQNTVLIISIVSYYFEKKCWCKWIN